MLKLIGKVYKGIKTYRTVKKAVNKVEDITNKMNANINNESVITSRAKRVINKIESKYKIDMPDNILLKTIDIGIKLAKNEKVSNEKKELCYMIVKYLYSEAVDIIQYIDKYFKNKKR